jgi:hypothetical protein
MSARPLKADIRQREWHVRNGPQTDIPRSLNEPCSAGFLPPGRHTGSPRQARAVGSFLISLNALSTLAALWVPSGSELDTFLAVRREFQSLRLGPPWRAYQIGAALACLMETWPEELMMPRFTWSALGHSLTFSRQRDLVCFDVASRPRHVRYSPQSGHS